MKFIENIQNKSKIKKAIRLLKENQIVAMPTENIYGLFIQATPENLKKLNEFKGAPAEKKITVMFSDREKAYQYLKLSKYQKSIIDSELPGNKTIIAEANTESIQKLIGKQKTLGIRVPSPYENKALLKVLNEVGPVLATSVNLHGQPPINDYHEIEKVFGDKLGYIVKYKIADPIPSTVVDITNDEVKILRKGR